MQRRGHGCSAEGTWVGRTREPASPVNGYLEAIQTERARITKKMLAAGSAGAPMQKPSEKIRTHYHCDTETEENNYFQSVHTLL